MRRRAFIAGLSASSASIPFASFAQQSRKLVIGCLGLASLKDVKINFGNVRRGLYETGFLEGRDYEVEYRAADYQPEKLYGLAAELVARDIAVIVTLASPALPAAQAATKSVPIVFLTGFDPVANGFVEGFNRPGTNLTGVFILTGPLGPKRLELLRELAPAAKSIAVLLSSTSLRFAKVKEELDAAAKSLGIQLVLQQADVPAEFEAAFDAIRRAGCGALVVGGDAVFTNNRATIVELVARYKIPAIYAEREYAVAGGLASYGPNYGEAYRLLGTYAGRILKGEKPADLPVQQVTKIEFVLNARTARELNMTFPVPLLGRADEVIE
jgi:putative tryptophan/tyrosine transport system substrate-binding protein